MNISVLVSGGGTNLQAIIDQIEDGRLPGVQIVRVISSRAGVYALERARLKGIPSAVISRKDFSCGKEYDDAMLNILKESKTDLVVAAGFLSLLGENIIRHYKNCVINIHPALIPAFCGKGMYGIHPHEAALERGVKITGATVHFMNEVYDQGPIFLQKTVSIEDDDTPEILQKRVMEECEWDILPRAIGLISQNKVQIVNNRVFITNS